MNSSVDGNLSFQTTNKRASFNLELSKEDTDYDCLYAEKTKSDLIHIIKDLQNELKMLKDKKLTNAGTQTQTDGLVYRNEACQTSVYETAHAAVQTLSIPSTRKTKKGDSSSPKDLVKPHNTDQSQHQENKGFQ